MRQAFAFSWGIRTATGKGGAWALLGPGGGGAQFFPTVSHHDSRKILVACDMTGAYITDDGGDTWAQFNLRSGVHTFAFDPIDPDTIYAGGSGLFGSEDGGKSWRLLFPRLEDCPEELMSGDHADHCFLPCGDWPGGEVRCIRVDDADNSTIVIGIHTDGKLLLYLSRDRGASWHELAEAEGGKCLAIYVESGRVAARHAFVFTDREISDMPLDGSSSRVAIPLPEGAVFVTQAAFGLNPETGEPVFYLITRNDKSGGSSETLLWKSEDKGRSWRALSVRLGGNTPPGAFHGLTALAVPGRDSRVLYAGVGKSPEYGQDTGAGALHEYFGVIRSDDGGASWRWALKSDYETDPENLQAGWAERDYGLPWHMTGPKGVGPIGLGVCPTDTDICCSTDLSSSFLTTDGGRSWRQIYSMDNPDGTVSSRGLEVTTCYGIHFDPFDNKHIAVSYTDIGAFHSPNGGRSWRHGISGVPVAWGNTCYWIAFDPDVPGRSWSAWGGAHDLPRPKMFRSGSFRRYEGGICISDDGMASWRPSNKGMPGNCVVTHIVLDPSSPPESRTLYATGFDRGVYKSTDGGASWALKDGGICCNRNAWRLTLLPGGTLYLLTTRGLKGREVVDGALYMSTDGAAHWERVALPMGVNAPNDLVFDPTDPKTMYLSCWPDETGGGGGGLYATHDGGESWRCAFDPFAHVYASAIHPDDPLVLFIVTFDSAAWYTEDRGVTWAQVEGYDFKWGHRPIVDPADARMLYITTFGSGVWHGPWRQNK